VNCEKPVNSRRYLDISTCFENGEYSSHSSLSHSKRYTYLVPNALVGELEDLCQIEQTFVTSWADNLG
jgi:hypothetical protein